MEVVSNAPPQKQQASAPLPHPGEEMDEINLEAAEDEQQEQPSTLFSAFRPMELLHGANELLASNPLIFTGLAVAVPVSLATALRVWHYDKDKDSSTGAAVAVHKR